MIMMSKCVVPWCEEDASDILGKWWHGKFCDEHIISLEEESCVRVDLLTNLYSHARASSLTDELARALTNCFDRQVYIREKYDIERIGYVVSFDVEALRTDFYDNEMLFVDRMDEERVV